MQSDSFINDLEMATFFSISCTLKRNVSAALPSFTFYDLNLPYMSLQTSSYYIIMQTAVLKYSKIFDAIVSQFRAEDKNKLDFAPLTVPAELKEPQINSTEFKPDNG